ncbi:allatostatin-A receptor-like [Lineus longissimus]|uniref:allatostatin-A receptor-like n=1 Tax=Lineus longissimus TaxID=88925 RepID=UPI00315DBDD7
MVDDLYGNATNGTNGTNGTEGFEEEGNNSFERAMQIAVPIIYSLVAIVGFVGNLLVIIVVVSNRQMRNTTNILIVSLAIADLSFIIFCVPFTTVSVTVPVWPFGEIWCKIVQYVTFVTAYVSIYTLALMSFDRYLAVVHAIAAMNLRTERNAYICVTITWIILLAVNVPVCFAYNIFSYVHEGSERAACIPFDPKGRRDLFTTFLAFGFVLPLVAIIILYGFMLNRLLYSVGAGSQSAETIRSRKRVTRMVIIVVVIFAVSWLPNHLCFMILYWRQNPPTEKYFYIFHSFARILAYANSCVNPILYAFLSENFRKGFRKILCLATKHNARLDFERTNTRPLLTGTTGATSLRSMGAGASPNENGL